MTKSAHLNLLSIFDFARANRKKIILIYWIIMELCQREIRENEFSFFHGGFQDEHGFQTAGPCVEILRSLFAAIFPEPLWEYVFKDFFNPCHYCDECPIHGDHSLCRS